MVARMSQCSDARLRQLLAADHESQVDPAWVSHVEVCRHCQIRLESLAAEPTYWDQTDSLADEPSLGKNDSRSQPSNAIVEKSASTPTAKLASKHQPNSSTIDTFPASTPNNDSGAHALDETALFASDSAADLKRPTAGDRYSHEATSNRLDETRMQSDDASKIASYVSVSAVELSFLLPSKRVGSLGRIAKYEVLEVIGRGGMGIVLRAHDQELDRTVAIKVLAPHLASNGAARQRFQREARAAAAVVHENVVAIHGVEAVSDLPYIVMPYVHGVSLQQYVDEVGPLEVEHALRIARQIASGLSAAHRQGIVHRDVKPANVLLEHGVDRVLLTDFGLARAADDASLTHTGSIAGTPHYMSPEQASGLAIDARSDLFSLGSVMYFMLTGLPPFRSDAPLAILAKIREEQPMRLRQVEPKVPAFVERMVERLLAKPPAARFADADRMISLIEHSLGHLLQPTRIAPPAVARVRKRRFSLPIFALFVIAASLFALLLVAKAQPWLSAFGVSSLPSNGGKLSTPIEPHLPSTNTPILTAEGAADSVSNRLASPSPGIRANPYAPETYDGLNTIDHELSEIARRLAILEADQPSPEFNVPLPFGNDGATHELDALQQQIDAIEREKRWSAPRLLSEESGVEPAETSNQ